MIPDLRDLGESVKDGTTRTFIENCTDVATLRKLADDLTELEKDIDCQLSAGDADLMALKQETLASGDAPLYFGRLADHKRWRGAAVRFKNSVSSRRAQAKTKISILTSNGSVDLGHRVFLLERKVDELLSALRSNGKDDVDSTKPTR